MNATIEKIVDLLFEDLEPGDEVAAIRDEILQNCQERYQDLRDAGISEDDAIHAVIESLNGMEEMLSAYPRKGAEPAASEPIHQPEQNDERSWSCDPAVSPIHEIRMEHMGRADVNVCVSEDDLLHVTCSNPKLTLMTGLSEGVLTIGLCDDKVEDIKISASDLKHSLEKGFDLSSIGRFVEKVAQHFTASVSSATVEVCIPASLNPVMSIHTASGDVALETLAFPSLQIGTASGDVEIKNTTVQGELRVASASGDITLNGGCAQLLQLSSTSGDVEVTDCSVQQSACVNTISGDITLEGTLENASFKTVSGDVGARFTGALQSVNAKTTSGDVSLKLPSGVQADVHCNTVSGDVHNHTNTQSGAAVAVSVSTVSGDISIR